MKVGVISDTHGLLRPEAESALAGSDLILHAGDIGRNDIISRLCAIAETHAIRGNIDKDDWAGGVPDTLLLEREGCRIYLLHNLKELAFDPAEEGIDVVISGHSHKPQIRREGRVLYLNPGSAGQRRFTLPIALAQLQLEQGRAEAEIIELEV